MPTDIMEVSSIAQHGQIFDGNPIRRSDDARMERVDQREPWSRERVAARLEALMLALNLTRSQVADAIGIDRSSFTKVMKAEKAFKPEWAYRMCEIYGATLDFIYRGQVSGLPLDLSRSVMQNLTSQDR